MSIPWPADEPRGELNQVWKALLLLWHYRYQFKYWDGLRWLLQQYLHDLQNQNRRGGPP